MDVSEEMINSSRKRLTKFLERIKFIREDVLVHLSKEEERYDVICSSSVIHNFNKEDQRKVFEAVYSKLKKNGTFFLLDKIYPDDKKEQELLLRNQLLRHHYLNEDLKSEIDMHEKQDFTDEYKMEETKTISLLKEIGFKTVKILDRVERDALLLIKN